MSVTSLVDTEESESYKKAIRQSVAGDMIQLDTIELDYNEEED